MTATPPAALHPLGRHVEHDPRSREFVATLAPAPRTVEHHRHCPPFDQGQLGSCTGNAIAGLLMTDPVRHVSWHFTERMAVDLYERATRLDSIPGQYPPDDTGSSGLAAAKAAKSRGYISGYAHAFGLDQALAALTLQPVIIGVNWYDSFDQPSPPGLVTITPGAQVRGGHEFELVGLDVAGKTVHACNSWGTGWGNNGFFHLSWSDLDRLLHEQGDVTTVSR